MDLIAANYRIPYTYDQIRFMSDSYMNGEVYFAGTNTLLTTTGGQYHRWGKGLWQPQYVAVDIPIIFTIGRHEISILSKILEKRAYKKATIYVTQKPVASWHKSLGGEYRAEKIIDRVQNNAYKLILKGESQRKLRSTIQQPED